MINDQQALLIAETLLPHQVKALKILARGAGDFERAGALPGLAQPMIDWMLEHGFAESGWANEYTKTVGYRLSPDGSKVWSALAKRRPKDRPQIRMLEPRIKQADLRIVKPSSK